MSELTNIKQLNSNDLFSEEGIEILKKIKAARLISPTAVYEAKVELNNYVTKLITKQPEHKKN
jgi:hypothetical protein